MREKTEPADESPDEPRPDICCQDLRDFINYWGTINVLTGFGMVQVLTRDNEYRAFKVCPYCGRQLLAEN